jgi:flagellum-specific peptidoglycan hydrolase FlgJ
MKKMKRLLISFCIVFLCTFTIIQAAYISGKSIDYQGNTIEYVDTLLIKQLQKDSIKTELINSVAEYIKTTAPKCHDSIPTYMVKHALIYDIDLCFMMGQTQLETNFGTAGAGRETSKRSLFGVHIYPNTPFKGYKNYDVAVEDYCKLLRKSYLVKGRDEHYLMNNYINRSGNRYAGSTNYETSLRINYRKIKSTTNIEELQEMYNSILL